MTPNPEDRGRLESIDRAVSREIEQRRRALRFYWGLLAIPVVVGVVLLLVDRGETKRAEGQMRTAAKEVLVEAAGEPEFIDTIGSSDLMTQKVESAADEVFVAFTKSSEFTDQMKTAAMNPDLYENLWGEIEQQGREIETRTNQALASAERSQREMIEHKSRETLSRAEEMARALATGPGGGSPISELKEGLDELSRNLERVLEEQELQRESIRELEGQLQGLELSARRPRSYLLKAKMANPLADLGLTAVAGARRDDGISELEILDGDKVLFPPSGSPRPVKFGETVTFEDRKGRRYEATLGYALSRRLARDYIGLEVLPLD